MERSTTIDSRLGFHAADPEDVAPTPLEVSGTIPTWLSGTLVRLTPMLVEAGAQPLVRHWFDGLACLNAFTIEGGQVGYAASPLDTATRRAATEGRFGAIGFGTDPCRTLGQRVRAFFSPTANDNTNVNLVRLGDRCLAMTETPIPREFDLDTLATGDPVPYHDHLGGVLATAHPHLDAETGDLLNLVIHAGPGGHSYRLYRWDGTSPDRRRLASLKVDQPRYQHSFALTEHHIVLTEWPLVYDLLAVIGRDHSVLDSMAWKPELGTRFTIIDRQTGEVTGQATTEARFAFHHVNAFEHDGVLELDLVAWDDPTPIWGLVPERLQNPDLPIDTFWGRLERYTVAATGGPIERRRLADERIEFPRTNYGRVNTHEHRYTWATSYATPTSDWYDAIVKVDGTDGTTTPWGEPGCYPSEPVFVPRPGATSEDCGVLLLVVLDAATAASHLVVLEASTMTELGRAVAPQVVPFGFHGDWFGSR